MQSLSTEISSRTFDIARRGYHPEQVDEYLADAGQQVAEMEDDLRASAVRIAALQRQVEMPKEATQSIETAYLAAAEAKQKLLEEARDKAAAIVAKAERDAEVLTRNPNLLAEEARAQATDVLLQAKARLEEANAEAERIVAKASVRSEQIVAEAHERAELVLADSRRDALAAVAAAEQEAKVRLGQTEARYRDLAGRLGSLQRAVASMLEAGANEYDEIRLVLEGALPIDRTDGIPAGHRAEPGLPKTAAPGG